MYSRNASFKEIETSNQGLRTFERNFCIYFECCISSDSSAAQLGRESASIKSNPRRSMGMSTNPST